MVDPKTAFGASSAALNLTNSILKLIETARAQGKVDPSLASIIEKMPGEAFSFMDQLENEAKRLRKTMVTANISPRIPVNAIESDPLWWTDKQGRAFHHFKPKVESILAELETFMDDIVAVAHCMGQDELIAASYEKALKRKRQLQKEMNYDRPIGEIIDVLIRYSRQLHAEAGSLLRTRSKPRNERQQ